MKLNELEAHATSAGRVMMERVAVTPRNGDQVWYYQQAVAFKPQYDAHVSAYIEHILREIEKVLGVTHYTLADWYACGDQLI